MPKDFCPIRLEVTPAIYAYEEPNNTELSGFLKVGFTAVNVQKRVAEQYPTACPGKPPYRITLEESAIKNAYFFVPMQDFSEPWTDEKPYAKYDLTQEEIAFIESMIRPMEVE
jgi:hypothetical protein